MRVQEIHGAVWAVGEQVTSDGGRRVCSKELYRTMDPAHVGELESTLKFSTLPR